MRILYWQLVISLARLDPDDEELHDKMRDLIEPFYDELDKRRAQEAQEMLEAWESNVYGG